MRALALSALLGLTLAGCEVRETTPTPAPTAEPARDAIATLDGVDVARAELEAFVARVRFPGYRPATEREARRLLFALLRERALSQEAARRGLDPDSLLVALTRPGESRRIVLDRLLARADVRFVAGALEPLVARASGSVLPPGHSGGPS